MVLSRISVNRNVVDNNKRHGRREPVLTVKSRGKTHYGDEVEVRDAAGQVLLRVFYRPDEPHASGASVWAETNGEVTLRTGSWTTVLPGCSTPASIMVSRRVVDQNKHHPTQEPVLEVHGEGGILYGFELDIGIPDSPPAVRVLYRPDEPLPCGATVWIETRGDVTIRNHGLEVALPGDMVRRGVRLREYLALRGEPDTAVLGAEAPGQTRLRTTS